MKKLYMLLAGALLWTSAGFAQSGADCSDPIVVDFSSLPYSDLSQSNCGSDVYDETCLNSYDGGDDIVYRLDVASETTAMITFDPKTTTYTGIGLFDGCPDTGSCIETVTNSNTSARVIETTLAAGTYYLMISTWPSPDCVPDFDLTISAVTCPSVTGLSVSDVTTTSAAVAWNTDGNTSWDVAVDTAGFDVEAVTPVNVTDTNYAATGLSEGMAYDVYVRVNCGENLGEWAMASFNTLAEGANCDLAIAVDFSSDLPWANAALSNCGYDLYDETCLGNYDNGDDVIYRFELASTMLTTITMDPNGTTYAGMGIFDGCVDEGECVATITNSSNSTPMTLEAELAAGTYYFMISTFASPQCIPDYDLSISAVEVTCPAVTGLSVSDVTATSAVVSWNTDENTSWDVALDTAGFDVETVTPVNVSDTSYAATGLDSEATYDVYVRVNCGEDVSDWMMVSFATPCVAEVQTVPYMEDFEGVSVPAMPCGWIVENLNSDDYTWESYGGTNSNIMSIRWNSTLAMDDLAKTPEIALTGGVSYTLEFNLRNGTTTWSENLAVTVGMDGSDPDTLLNLVDFQIVDFEKQTAEFTPATDGNYRIGFYGYSIANQLRIRIDDIELDVTPDCPAPTGVTVSDINDNSAVVSWNDMMTSYEVLYDTAGFDPMGMTPITVADTSYSITGLNPETAYDVYVRSVCGEDSYSEWVLVSFTTLCDASVVFEVPYNEDFEGVNVPEMPCGWIVDNANGDDYTWVSFGGATTEMFIRYNVTVAMDDLARTPELALTGGVSYTLFYDQRVRSSVFPENLAVILYDASNTADTLLEFIGFTNTDFETKFVDFTPAADGNYRIGFYGFSPANQWEIRVDNIMVVETPDCVMPLGVSISDITSTSATVSWNNMMTSYEVLYDTAGFDPMGMTPISVSDTSYEITGLDIETAYDVYVRSDCGEDGFSEWVLVSFTTLPPPPANDLPCDALDIVVDGDSVIVDNTSSTISGPEPECWAGDFITGDVWLSFDFTPTEDANGVVISTTAGSITDSQLALYSIDGCPDGELTFTELACDDDGGEGLLSLIDPLALDTGTYYIQCTGYNTNEGSFNVFVNSASIADPPANNTCDGASVADVIVDGDPTVVTGTGIGATASETFPAAEVWEAFTITECADVVISFCGSTPVATALYVNLFDSCPIGVSQPDATITGEFCEDGNLAAVFSLLPAGTYYYPVIADVALAGGFEDYTMTITATACPPCLPVTNLAANVLGTSATITWDATADGAYQLVWGLAGIDPTTETPIDLVDATYDVSGLEPGVAYDVYVRNNCEAAGSGFSEWSFITFTASNAIEGESFEGEVFPPETWTSIDNDGDGQDWFQYGFDPYAGAFSAASASWTGTTGALTPDNFLVTPQRTVTSDNSDLRFYVAAQDPAYPSDFYGVWISTTGNAAGDFTDELFSEVIEDEIWDERIVDLSAYVGQNVYLAFRHYESEDWFYMKIDNVVLPGVPVGVNEVSEKSDFAIYPNPNNGQFTLTNEDANGDYLIELIDMTGKVVYSQLNTLTSGQNTEITTESVKRGIYMVKLTNTENNAYRTIRMVVQ